MASVPASWSSPSSEQSQAEFAALQRLEATLGRSMPVHAVEARAAFLRDLPRLLREKPNQWVAYRAEKQIAIGKDKTAVYQECLGAGLEHGDFVVFCIEPPSPREVTLPADV